MSDYVEDQSLMAAAKLRDLNVPREVVDLLFTVRAALQAETFGDSDPCIVPFLSWRLAESYTQAVTALVDPVKKVPRGAGKLRCACGSTEHLTSEHPS